MREILVGHRILGEHLSRPHHVRRFVSLVCQRCLVGLYRKLFRSLTLHKKEMVSIEMPLGRIRSRQLRATMVMFGLVVVIRVAPQLVGSRGGPQPGSHSTDGAAPCPRYKEVFLDQFM